MRAFKKLLTVTRYLVIVLSFISGFAVGAIFGETVVNKFGQPTFLTFYLAGEFDVDPTM
jgi:uncharacterized membrane protein YoaK (UPF0700 family)